MDALRVAGIVDLRINYVHGGVMTWKGAKALSAQLRDRGTHIPMLADPGDHIADLAEDIRQSPVRLVLDHLGWP
ncbi:MAG: hypothetical protein NXH97_03300 [Rhodobacteraceae bacterium]|nr:hypothetical protein [Paracoccaceae bacterium]